MNGRLLLLAVLTGFVLGYGVCACRDDVVGYFIERNYRVEESLAKPVHVKPVPFSRYYSDVSSRREVPCPRREEVFVIVGFGQSNSANHDSHRFAGGKGDILNYFDGKCYLASDPMLGATGNGGSIWIPFADKLGLGRKILLVTLGIGATSVHQWLHYGAITSRMHNVLDGLRSAGYRPDLFVWVQGEADVDTVPGNFEHDLGKFLGDLQAAYPDSLISLSSTSYCIGKSSKAITDIQKHIADTHGMVWLGNTDLYSSSIYRDGDCHLSELGQERVADMFARSVRNALRQTARRNGKVAADAT